MMRAGCIVSAAAIAALLPLKAMGQAAPSLGMMMICSEIKTDAERLQCFDKLIAQAQKAPPQSLRNVVSTPDQNWKISEGKSPVDDTPQFAAVVESNEGTSALILRCGVGSSEAFVNVHTYVGGAEALRVVYRINQDAAVEQRWQPAKDGDAVFVPNGVFFPFVRALPDEGTLFVRLFDFQSRAIDMTFKLGPISDVRDKLATGCRWPSEEQKPAVANAAPAPSRLPSAIKIVSTPMHEQRWNVGSQRHQRTN